MTFLKSEHGITHGIANFITLKFREADAASSDADDLVANQYKGKESLKPIFDKLLMTITNLGSDVEVVAKKSAVSLRVKRQFALIQPSTKKRIDLGLKFNNTPHSERLETSGPFGTMCTHRVQLTELDQVDNELIKWIKEANEQAK
jgi:predicted transport protein